MDPVIPIAKRNSFTALDILVALPYNRYSGALPGVGGMGATM